MNHSSLGLFGIDDEFFTDLTTTVLEDAAKLLAQEGTAAITEDIFGITSEPEFTILEPTFLQPTAEQLPSTTAANFFEKNKAAIAIGGAVVGGLVLLKLFF